MCRRDRRSGVRSRAAGGGDGRLQAAELALPASLLFARLGRHERKGWRVVRSSPYLYLDSGESSRVICPAIVIPLRRRIGARGRRQSGARFASVAPRFTSAGRNSSLGLIVARGFRVWLRGCSIRLVEAPRSCHHCDAVVHRGRASKELRRVMSYEIVTGVRGDA